MQLCVFHKLHNCCLQNGLPKKQFDRLRLEFLRTYGHPHILTLSALQDAGERAIRRRGRLPLCLATACYQPETAKGDQRSQQPPRQQL